MPIKFIYFDLGGVLFIDLMVSNRWDRFVDDLGVPAELKDKFNSLYDKYEPLFNTGKMHTDEFVKIVEERLGVTLKTKDLLQSLVDQFYANKSLQKILIKIKKHFRVGLLTNMYIGMLDAIFYKGIVPVHGWEVVIDSSKVAMAKPDERIFKYAQAQVKLPAEDILFVDNSPVNVKAAARLGWQTLLYNPADVKRSNERLLSVLRAAV